MSFFFIFCFVALVACANVKNFQLINNTLAGLGCFARKALCPLADFAPGECMTMPGNIKCDVNGSITTLSLNNCSLAGTLPTDIAKLTTLTALILSRNSLKGTISPVFATLIHLRILRLFGNDFTGDVPTLPVASLTECRIQDPVLAGNCINVATCPTECICNLTAADPTCRTTTTTKVTTSTTKITTKTLPTTVTTAMTTMMMGISTAASSSPTTAANTPMSPTTERATNTLQESSSSSTSSDDMTTSDLPIVNSRQSVAAISNASNSNIGVIIGAAVGGVLCCAIVIAVIIVVVHRQNASKPSRSLNTDPYPQLNVPSQQQSSSIRPQYGSVARSSAVAGVANNGVVVSSYAEVPSQSIRTSAIPEQPASIYQGMSPPSSDSGGDQRYGQLNLIKTEYQQQPVPSSGSTSSSEYSNANLNQKPMAPHVAAYFPSPSIE